MTSLIQVIAIVSLLQPQLSGADGACGGKPLGTPFDQMLQQARCAGSSDDITSLLQVKQAVQTKRRSEPKLVESSAAPQAEASMLQKAQFPVRVEPPQVVFDLPPMPGGPAPMASLPQGGMPESTALNSMGYPMAAGYPVGALGGYPMGGLGGYPMGGHPMGQAAAQAAQIGANNVVAQTASTITQAANVAQNSAVAAESFRHYASPYYSPVAPGYPMGAGYPIGAGYPTFMQQPYGGYPYAAGGYPSAAGGYGYPYAAGGAPNAAGGYGYPYAAGATQPYFSVVP